MMNLFKQLTSIDPSKECLKFLAHRILSTNYRGVQLSQHNRYDVNVISTLLTEMYDIVGINKMRIRTTDLKKRPYNTPDEYIYAKYVNNLINKIGRCTQDSVRKNLFVDLNRMGLINRFDKNDDLIYPYEKKGVYSVCLSKKGLDFVKSVSDIFQRNLLYTKAIDELTNGLANEILDIVSINNKISIYEFMFFISYIDLKCDFNGHVYTKSELVEYMLEFRKLSFHQRKAVIDAVDLYCNPKKFSGDKTNKRDFHNWKNESQQIFMLMNQTVFYEERNEELYIRIGDAALFEDESKLKRSLAQKQEYFKKHNITKKIGFELHHVIPLLSARNRIEFQTLDVWENMIYIDGYTHSKISHTNNKNTKLEFVNDNIILKDTAMIIEDILCVNRINVLYDVSKQYIMKEYNESISNLL